LSPFSRQEIERALIQGHYQYGGLIHEKVAEALIDGLSAEPSDTPTGHALASRLFGEFAASLETHGAWAWSLRNRFQRGSFLDAYLAYRNADIEAFYKLVETHEGDLSGLLRLPSPNRIAEAARKGPYPEFYADELLITGFEMRYARMKDLAEMYFSNDRILIDTYNKTKHGAPMVRLVDRDNARQFEVIVAERPPISADPYLLAKFTVNKALITKLRSNIASITTSITELGRLTKLIDDVGLLYERG
jgi:hypothetical protein